MCHFHSDHWRSVLVMAAKESFNLAYHLSVSHRRWDAILISHPRTTLRVDHTASPFSRFFRNIGYFWWASLA